MLEFSNQVGQDYRLAFAGDTYNAAYYARMCAPKEHLEISYVTALGDDPYSSQMLAAWSALEINVEHVRRLPGYLPGLYLLHNDEQRERHFYYYRSQAAVRHLFDGDEGDNLIQQLNSLDAIYFSGITLAVLLPESLDKFYFLLVAAKKQGTTIIFDNNYRAKLWDNARDAQNIN